ncbi:MAG: 16S rRNA (cytidine(1402)-2'-O)-methyltransferase [Ignavibacterium sp.]
MNSTLYIVSTPIGNLKDITLRAIEILKEVDFIICEDTRVASILLNNFEIKKELTSLNAFNEKNKIDFLIKKLEEKSAALISDAGTPTISDPGIKLVSLAINNGISVIPIPGPSALIAALTVAGFPTNSFLFEGFLPQKKGRQKLLFELSKEKRTIILYESSHRIEKLLNELNEFMPNRMLAVCRELTKKFEEVIRGYPNKILSNLKSNQKKGEFVIVISPLNWKE